MKTIQEMIDARPTTRNEIIEPRPGLVLRDRQDGQLRVLVFDDKGKVHILSGTTLSSTHSVTLPSCLGTSFDKKNVMFESSRWEELGMATAFALL